MTTFDTFFSQHIMKQIFNILIIVTIAVSFSYCTTQQKKRTDNAFSDNSTRNAANSFDIAKVSGNCAIGPFHWNITSDAYSSISDQWIKKLSGKNHIPMFSGLRLKNDDELTPTFNSEGHLTALRINFYAFSVHPEKDYSSEEKVQIENMYHDNNKRISNLIRDLNAIYGESTANEYDENDISFYTSNEEKALAEWNTDETHASLKIKNTCIDDYTGCNLNIWIEISEIQ